MSLPAGVSVTDYLGQNKEVALVVAADQFVAGGGIVLLFGGLLSTLSALNATIYSSSRVAFAMARDASLPQAMARVHPVRGTPHVSILVSTLVVVTMAVALPIEDVAAAASVMFLLLFGGVSVALVRLRRTHPHLDRGFRVPFVRATTGLSILAMLFLAVLLFRSYPLAWAAAAAWIVGGVGFYYAYSRKRETAFHARTSWMERIERAEYRVLVGISSARQVTSLMEAALALARKNRGEVVVLHVLEVPEGEPLSRTRPVPSWVLQILDTAVHYAEDRGVAAVPVVRIGHRVSHTLVQTAREKGCNFLLIGQAPRPSFMERLVSSIVERVLREAPCQVGVVSGTIQPGQITAVVVPVTRGRNSELAARLAPAFAEWFQVPARAVTVIGRELSDAEAEPAGGGDPRRWSAPWARTWPSGCSVDGNRHGPSPGRSGPTNW